MRHTGPTRVKFCADCHEFERDLEKKICPKCKKSERLFTAYQGRRTDPDTGFLGSSRTKRRESQSFARSKWDQTHANRDYHDEVLSKLRDFYGRIDYDLGMFEIKDDEVWAASCLLGLINNSDTSYEELEKTIDKEIAYDVKQLAINEKIPEEVREIEFLIHLKNLPLMMKVLKLVEINASIDLLTYTEDKQSIEFVLEKTIKNTKEWKKNQILQLKKYWENVFSTDLFQYSHSIVYTNETRPKDPPKIQVLNENGKEHFFNMSRYMAGVKENSDGSWTHQGIKRALDKIESKNNTKT